MLHKHWRQCYLLMEAIDSLCTVSVFTEALVIYFSGQRKKNEHSKQATLSLHYQCCANIDIIITDLHRILANGLL